MDLDDNQVQQMIDGSIKNYNQDARFSVVPIPAHTHNGVDSLPIDHSNIIGLSTPGILRVASNTTTATPQPIATMTDLFDITSATGSISFQNPSGLPLTNGQVLRLRVTSSNSATARALSFSSATGGYIGNSPALPSATVTGQTMMMGFMYDTTNSLNKWRLFELANGPSTTTVASAYGVPPTLGNYLTTSPTAGNVTDQVTVNFPPGLIELHYLLQGKNGGLSSVSGRKGIVVFNGTTQLSDLVIFSTVGTAGHTLTGDLGSLQTVDAVIAPNVTATAPTTGDLNSNNGVKFTLSISATDSTSFTINLAIALSGSFVSAGDNYRCQIFYKVLK